GADGLPSLKLAAELVNVFDTSSHYENESFLGPVLGESSLREEFILCTKVGHVRGEPPKGAVPIKGDDWHCIEPSFVEAEVRACKERLRTVPDIVFLHNPEYMLSARLKQQVPIADAWDEMYQALFQAFKALETLCSEGSISSGYGVSSNFLSCSFSVTGRPNLYESLVLDRVLDAASAAAGAQGLSQHRFQVAQLPLNLFESGAVLGRGAQMEGDCFMAERLGVSLLTNRPLNALPMPGVSAGDWGRSASHLQIREAKPMGAVPSLLKRVLKEVLGEAASQLKHQELLSFRSKRAPFPIILLSIFFEIQVYFFQKGAAPATCSARGGVGAGSLRSKWCAPPGLCGGFAGGVAGRALDAAWR
ncbi:unnamed protein product, partial [Effrenium voratum]